MRLDPSPGRPLSCNVGIFCRAVQSLAWHLQQVKHTTEMHYEQL